MEITTEKVRETDIQKDRERKKEGDKERKKGQALLLNLMYGCSAREVEAVTAAVVAVVTVCLATTSLELVTAVNYLSINIGRILQLRVLIIFTVEYVTTLPASLRGGGNKCRSSKNK